MGRFSPSIFRVVFSLCVICMVQQIEIYFHFVFGQKKIDCWDLFLISRICPCLLANRTNLLCVENCLCFWLKSMLSKFIYSFLSLSLLICSIDRSTQFQSVECLHVKVIYLRPKQTQTSPVVFDLKKMQFFFPTATSKSNCIRHYIKMQRTIVDCLMKNEWTHCHLINLVDAVVQQQAMIIMEMHTQRFIFCSIYFNRKSNN